MTYATQEWVRGLELPRAPKTVLAALAGHQNRKTGDCFPSHETLAKDTGYSERTVRRYVSWLRDAGLISTARRFKNDGRVSTHNYSFAVDWNSLTSGQADHRTERPQDKKDVTTGQKAQLVPLIEEPEEEPEVNAHPATFAEFWIVWPRSESKKTAEKAWASAIKREKPDVILAAAIAYATHPNRTAKQYVPYGATWLNKDLWNDPLPEAPQQPQQRTLTRAEQNLALAHQMRAEQASQKGIAS